MSWNLDKATNQESGGEKTAFTKFPEGITRITVLGDAPHVRWTHWQPKFKRSINCPGRGCPICEIRKREKANGQSYTHDMGRRFTIEVYNHDTQKLEILDQGKTFMEDLRDVMENLSRKGKKLSEVTLDVKRRGMGKDNTSYRIDVAEEVLPVPSGLELRDLNEYFKPHTPEMVLAVLNVPYGSPEELLEAWIKITSPESAQTDNSAAPAPSQNDNPFEPPAPTNVDPRAEFILE